MNDSPSNFSSDFSSDSSSESPQEHYDAILIGVGQANAPLATALLQKGWKIAVVERKYVGGTCVNYGCTPTKAMIASAKIAYQARQSADWGVHTGPVSVDLPAILQRKEAIVEQFRHGIEKRMQEAAGLTLIYGEAYFVGQNVVAVEGTETGRRLLSADKIFINSGVSPRPPAFEGVDTIPWLNSTTIMELEILPRHLLIVGGGYIGLEFGQMFRRFGSEVTIVERGDQVLSKEDADMAEEVKKILEAENIQVLLQTQIQRVTNVDPETIQVELTDQGKARQMNVSHVLIAQGVTPNTAELRLEAAGVETDEKGFIRVNERLEASQPGIYALGDINGGPQFTHISYDDYRVVAKNLFGEGSATTTGRLIPYTVFIDPQLAHVGLHEKEALAKGYSIQIASITMDYVARAIETGQTQGKMKIVIDAQTNQMLGATVLGLEGGELMSMLQIAMMGKLPYQRLRDAIFAHPTLAESLNTLFGHVGPVLQGAAPVSRAESGTGQPAATG